MATLASGLRPSMPYLTLGAVGISLALVLRSLDAKTLPIKSPRDTLLPKLNEDEIAALPYPPDILPGSRDVSTPYGLIKVFEWGPEDGERILLLHGISTPCLSLANLAEELVAQGYRVLLFDFFGRGYSDTPTDVPYDIRLYTSQILLVLASSNLPWTGDDGFHLIGYSLGGGVAVAFTKYFPHMVRSLVLVAGGGLIRHEHLSTQSKILYSTGIFPEWALGRLVKKRLMPRQVLNEEQMAAEVVGSTAPKRHKNSDASGGDSYDNAVLSMRRPGLTVSVVMNFQLLHHEGFIHAFMSSIRHAPIYQLPEQQEDWLALGRLLAARRTTEGFPGLKGGRVLFLLGNTDSVIVREELIHDATALLGEEAVEAISLDCGHEIVMTKGETLARLAIQFWKDES
ncbi:Alpha/Beta hydrolase protein [Cercophora newfieldiana]|uniref:Alpha/Beta hydrolase protein n=1 Tax=Cercophora newfieldiana TaxID=92897 RepID=A0AA39YNJ4_9PEZI|nr:Alpha/Beta hydrolase protein [Cercophora newfieldiana]